MRRQRFSMAGVVGLTPKPQLATALLRIKPIVVQVNTNSRLIKTTGLAGGFDCKISHFMSIPFPKINVI